MNISPKVVILINGVVLFLVVMWLLSARKRLKPSRLNMKSKSSNSPGEIINESSLTAQARKELMDFEKAKAPSASGHWSESTADASGPIQKELNVVFNFNGHSFDAFEVLGLPAGSSVDKARLAHRQIKSTIDPESVALVDAALQAILQSR